MMEKFGLRKIESSFVPGYKAETYVSGKEILGEADMRGTAVWMMGDAHI